MMQSAHFSGDIKNGGSTGPRSLSTHLNLNQEKRRKQFDRIAKDMDRFTTRVSRVGFNSVSLDDVAHLTPDPWYEPEINQTISILMEEFLTLFSIIKKNKLDIYLTMDVLAYTPALKGRIGGKKQKALQFIKRQIETLFSNFPEVQGIIFRIGECDGNDISGNFKSELFLRTPREVNQLLHELLPLFEKHQRTMILRNWTIGAYRIGDFIWHRRTTAKVLDGIDSPNFILSMKYGESDFFPLSAA